MEPYGWSQQGCVRGCVVAVVVALVVGHVSYSGCAPVTRVSRSTVASPVTRLQRRGGVCLAQEEASSVVDPPLSDCVTPSTEAVVLGADCARTLVRN